MNGIRTKLGSLKLSIACCSYDVIILVETNLADDIRDVELGFDGYNISVTVLIYLVPKGVVVEFWWPSRNNCLHGGSIH